MKQISKLLLGSLIAFTSFNTLADGKRFSVKVDNLKNGRFTEQQLLSESYGFGCTGGNQSPAISWKNAPRGTKSFVLTLHDKDAPTGLGWMHWVVANIPADVNHISAGKLPENALATRTDIGTAGYMGACPPKGKIHRYELTLTAVNVDKLLHISADSTPALVGFFTKAHALGSAKITIKQSR